MTKMVKYPPAVQETPVQSLSEEDPPGERNDDPFQFSCLGNLMDREEPGGLQPME